MTAPTDPTITFRDLSDQVGVSLHLLKAWQAAGFLPSAGRGKTTLLAALRGIMRALEAEAEDKTPYRATVYEIPEGHIPEAEADAGLGRVAAALDDALAQAIRAAEAVASEGHRLPVTREGRQRAARGEAARTRLYAGRRRVASFPQVAKGLIQAWETANGK